MAPPRKSRPAPATAAGAPSRLLPPTGGAVVRMYRIGHGDCFLIAFDGQVPDRPVYVLIDCGYKPGSPEKIPRPEPRTVADITASIRAATGGEIDIAIITHEHQDHLNGITASNFAGLEIKETWLAWTEDPDDAVANALRKKFKDTLLGLIAARHRLAAAGEASDAARLDDFLAFELGGDEEAFDLAAATTLLGAAGKPAGSKNKQSLKLLKDRAREGVRYLRPHQEILPVPGARNARVFVLGPPRDQAMLLDVDPIGREEFHVAQAAATSFFASAFAEEKAGTSLVTPFADAYALPTTHAFEDAEHGDFFRRHYGSGQTAPTPTPRAPAVPASESAISAAPREVPDDAPWRRIDGDWLHSALQLAIEVNNATNNSSLVLAFELGVGGKVLLFAADAQRGNWVSWADAGWSDGPERVQVKDLLARTVLYKVGHHGSHNATLNGSLQDLHPNLSWMGRGKHAREFTAMITAVRAWAETQKGWNHPLKAIKDALLTKCAGRVFQTDTPLEAMRPGESQSSVAWKRFESRVAADPLYFDLRIEPGGNP